MNFQIREAIAPDQQGISEVVIAAFGHEQGQEIVTLVTDLLQDPTASPRLSLVATNDEQIVGHVLFTHIRLKPAPQQAVPSAILAPLTVHPNWQNQGIGSQLITAGINQLKSTGVGLVFVLGYPDYYSKQGFSAAGSQGFAAPHPIAPQNAEAWMVQELRPGVIGSVTGTVICADTLNAPQHWQE